MITCSHLLGLLEAVLAASASSRIHQHMSADCGVRGALPDVDPESDELLADELIDGPAAGDASPDNASPAA